MAMHTGSLNEFSMRLIRHCSDRQAMKTRQEDVEIDKETDWQKDPKKIPRKIKKYYLTMVWQ